MHPANNRPVKDRHNPSAVRSKRVIAPLRPNMRSSAAARLSPIDGVVGPARQLLGDVGPAVASAVLLALEDDAILGLGPGSLGDGGVEVVVPPLSALLPDAS